MRTILIINDNSSEAKHAAEFALIIAQKMQADILLVNTAEINKKARSQWAKTRRHGLVTFFVN